MSVHETIPEMVRRLEAEIARLRWLEAAVEDGSIIDDGFGDLGGDVVASLTRYRASLLSVAMAKENE